ncbi:MAG: hypothetical protein QW728_02550 [Thermoplasmata archaeon]
MNSLTVAGGNSTLCYYSVLQFSTKEDVDSSVNALEEELGSSAD